MLPLLLLQLGLVLLPPVLVPGDPVVHVGSVVTALTLQVTFQDQHLEAPVQAF